MFLRRLLTLACLVAAGCILPSRAAEFVPQQYQSADGALVLSWRGDFVEPYFAAKALLEAQDAGLDIRKPALEWIAWTLPRQRKDGRIERYCKAGAGWKHCGPADADDSMLALWLQLLYRMAPDTGLPAEWQESARRAQQHLDSLRNRRLGVYHISHRNHVALLMDNIEVYSALQDIAQAQRRFAHETDAERTAASARDLANAIYRIFWDKGARRFRISTQKEKRGSFYPDALAQTYPLLAGLPAGDQDPRSAWLDWRDAHAAEWLEKSRDPHPWGLVALTALKMGDSDTAVCWLTQSEPFRYSKDWNVLEEAIYQGLEAELATQRQTQLTACSTGMARR